MIIHDMKECEQWMGYRAYGISTKVLMFQPKTIYGNEKEPRVFGIFHTADIVGKSFQHNEERVITNINAVAENYPKLQPILENLHIFFCPKPSADTANACANDLFITYYARCTQIPFCMTDYITGHELGHVVQFSLAPDYGEDDDKFRQYLELRNVDKIYRTNSWDGNPQEWFAEDFRWFFGVDKGEPFWGLPIPKPDERIKEFMLSL